MIEIHLHREGILSLSATIKHDWFTSVRRTNERIKQEFGMKQEILKIIVELEEKRNILAYGKQQPRPYVEEYLETFNKLKETLEEAGVDYE